MFKISGRIYLRISIRADSSKQFDVNTNNEPMGTRFLIRYKQSFAITEMICIYIVTRGTKTTSLYPTWLEQSSLQNNYLVFVYNRDSILCLIASFNG